MTEKVLDGIQREFWAFLHSRGFPSGIDDEALQAATLKVDDLAYAGKKVKMRDWRYVVGAQHDDDVALVMLLADALRLEEGVDWDWGLEPDEYHFEIAYTDGDKVHELSRLVDLYREANLVLLNIYRRLGEDVDLQQIFSEEWQRITEDEQHMKQVAVRILQEASKEAATNE